MVLDILAVFNIYIFVEALWVALPAYAANGLVPLLGLRKRSHPVDFGRMFIDGKPVLGPGKTWEGIALGVVLGVVIALVEMLAFPFLPFGISPVPLLIVPMGITLGFMLGLGAMFGDLCGSFVKRRLNLRRGAAAPVLDQDDFILGAFAFAAVVSPIKWEWIIIMLVLTPIFHLIASMIGYLIKVKKEPY